MFGQFNSVASRLINKFPGLTLFKCSCHSLHLCASEAAKKLPRACEELVRQTYLYFSSSAKRRFEFKTFLDFYEEDPLSILHPNQTRWLSLYRAVDRILLHWDALKEYFNRLKETKIINHPIFSLNVSRLISFLVFKFYALYFEENNRFKFIISD